METHATPQDRLKAFMRAKGITASELSDYLGLNSNQTLTPYLPGKSVRKRVSTVFRTKTKLDKLEELGLNIQWYHEGTGEMFNNNEVNDVPKKEIDELYNVEVHDLPAHANVGSLANFEDLPVSIRKCGVFMGVKPDTLKGIRVSGDSMKDARIYNGDIVLYDTSLEPKSGCEVVAVLNGTVLIKTYYKNEYIELHSSYNGIPPIIINEIDDNFRVIGVVKSVLSIR